MVAISRSPSFLPDSRQVKSPLPNAVGDARRFLNSCKACFPQKRAPSMITPAACWQFATEHWGRSGLLTPLFQPASKPSRAPQRPSASNREPLAGEIHRLRHSSPRSPQTTEIFEVI